MFPEGGRVATVDVVVVNVGKENVERVKGGTNETVVAEGPEGTPKVNDALDV